jgi:hypothetical protein
MGHGLFSVAEIAADSFIVRMGQPTAARSERQVVARGLPHDSVVWLGAKRSRGVSAFCNLCAFCRQFST